MEEFNKELGEKIYHYRKAVKMSSATLAEKAGLGQSTISKVENGLHTINLISLIKICEVLGITIFDVLPRSVLPKSINNNDVDPKKFQLHNLIDRMSESEVEFFFTFVLTFLKLDITPALDSINAIAKKFETLNDQERQLLITVFNSITSK